VDDKGQDIPAVCRVISQIKKDREVCNPNQKHLGDQKKTVFTRANLSANFLSNGQVEASTVGSIER